MYNVQAPTAIYLCRQHTGTWRVYVTTDAFGIAAERANLKYVDAEELALDLARHYNLSVTKRYLNVRRGW